jgi:hypothetical protein
MHYSLSLVGNTIIVYHALTRVLGNDKRFGVELPADLVLDLTPGAGRVGLIEKTPRLEAVLGKTHRTEF